MAIGFGSTFGTTGGSTGANAVDGVKLVGSDSSPTVQHGSIATRSLSQQHRSTTSSNIEHVITARACESGSSRSATMENALVSTLERALVDGGPTHDSAERAEAIAGVRPGSCCRTLRASHSSGLGRMQSRSDPSSYA